jgi:valyl-tRNA synthetase
MLRLFAPFLPFVTEEVWSWWQEGSVHRAAWPTPEEVLAGCEPVTEDQRGVDALEFATTVLGAIRKKKSEEQRPLKTAVARASIQAPAAQLALLADVEHDLRAAGLIEQIESVAADAFHVEVVLVSAEPAQEPRG